MFLFAISNVLLKFRRKSLPSETRASYFSILIAFSSAIVAIVASILCQPTVVVYLVLFFGFIFGIVLLHYSRVSILVFLLSEMSEWTPDHQFTYGWVKYELANMLNFVESAPVVLLTSFCDIKWLNEAIQYVRDNEATRVIKVVHIVDDISDIPEFLEQNIQTLNDEYPSLRIDANVFEGNFSPEMLNNIASFFNISKHSIFIGCPGYRASRFNFADLGGARIITSCHKQQVSTPRVRRSLLDQAEVNRLKLLDEIEI